MQTLRYTLLITAVFSAASSHCADKGMSVSAGKGGSVSSFKEATRSTSSFTTSSRQKSDFVKSVAICCFAPPTKAGQEEFKRCVATSTNMYLETAIDQRGTVSPGALSPEALAALLKAATSNPQLKTPTPTQQDDSDSDDDRPAWQTRKFHNGRDNRTDNRRDRP